MFKKKLRMSLLVLCLIFCLALPSLVLSDGKININTASVKELATLDKVGEKYAQRIVEYRESNGSFAKADDITKVKGIGSKILEANKDRIVVE